MKEKNNSPVISIITPVYKVSLDYFRRTEESVREQTYTKWEWCIVDDGSNDLELSRYLRSIQNSKIKVKILKNNRGISEATNEAMKMASGSYIGFLDHDDLLDYEALEHIVNVIKENPTVDVIYTDEDKVIYDNIYKDPFYKPDFNYTLLLSSMYICHFTVYKREILKNLKLRKEFDGAQDYDLILRVIEKTKNIRHIKKILYHWRISKTSAAFSILNKPQAYTAGLNALRDHFRRINVSASVYGSNYPCHYTVTYNLHNKPKVSVIVPFKDNVHLLKDLITTFRMTDYENYKIVLVNNNSERKETYQYLDSLTYDRITLVNYHNKFNFSTVNNFIVNKYVDSELILFLNSDIKVIHPDWLYNMVQYFVREEVGIVGAKLLYLDHRIQHAGVFISKGGYPEHLYKGMYDWESGYFNMPHRAQEVPAVTGACMLVRTTDFINVKGFDEKLPLAFNDIDFCFKIRKIGKVIIYTPLARLYHHESATRGYDSIKDIKFRRALRYFRKKWNLIGD